MQFKGKKENLGNILWLHHPSYTMKVHKCFGRHLGGTCSIQMRLRRTCWASGSDESSVKAKITPGDSRWGRMQNCAGIRAHERMQVTKLMVTRTSPDKPGRHVGLLHVHFPTATASQLAYKCFVVMHWEGIDCIPRESGSPAWGRLTCWGLRRHQTHYFLKYIKCVQGLSCVEMLIRRTSKCRSHISSVNTLQEETGRGVTCSRSQLKLEGQWQAWEVSDLVVLSPVRFS